MTQRPDPREMAESIVETELGRFAGPLIPVESQSSRVFVGRDVVVKLAEHSRLDREIRLVGHLPPGLTPELLAGGARSFDGRSVQFACYRRAPGVTPGAGLPGVDVATARSLAEQAMERLAVLHRWRPPDDVAEILRQPLDHGGFTTRDELLGLVEQLVAADRHRVVDRALVHGLVSVAEGAPRAARTDVPVHADCYWENWLASDGDLTALLDFEWARFGDPLDDYFFLVSFSGEHEAAVMDVVAEAAGISGATLRRECEVRQATFLVSDILLALTGDEANLPGQLLTRRLASLDQLVTGRRWHPSVP